MWLLLASLDPSLYLSISGRLSVYLLLRIRLAISSAPVSNLLATSAGRSHLVFSLLRPSTVVTRGDSAVTEPLLDCDTWRKAIQWSSFLVCVQWPG